MIDTAPRQANPASQPIVAHIPGSTYRLQFHAGFTFRDAAALVPYLKELGITDVYASPYLMARAGSSHGYDVADPNALNPEIGTQADYDAFYNTLAKAGMGQVLDIVPNHMGIGDVRNHLWLDVLENGPSSIFAGFFDIDWNPTKPDVQDKFKVILPVLGDQYGRVLENGELTLSYQDGAFILMYYDLVLPISPKSYVHVLSYLLDTLEQELGPEHDQVLELQSIITALTYLPSSTVSERRRVRERNREKEIIKRRIDRLCQDCAGFRRTLAEALTVFNGRKGDRASFDRLDVVLAEQSYRLAFWRVAADEINYRRFFDVNELAAVRMEDPQVFEYMHRLLLELVREGRVCGLRIDHPDGLRDPGGYFWRLQRACYAILHAARVAAEMPDLTEEQRRSLERDLEMQFDRVRETNPRAPALKPMYIVVEKILSGDETLPESWPVHGTTGYDFLATLNGIFVDRDNRDAFDALYARFTGRATAFRDTVNSTKKMVMLISLAGEVNTLGYELKRIANRSRLFRDFTLNSLTFAIREVIAALPVYRTYLDPQTGAVNPGDPQVIDAAVRDAQRRNPRTDPSIFRFVGDTLLLRNLDDATPEQRAEVIDFVARFQQTSGPVMAKGAEDTAFYQYNRLVALNEVGGEPGEFGTPLKVFHARNAERARAWPASMLALSTHDTKRSEDVRARVNVLSELPREWGAALTRWSRMNARKRVAVDGRQAPDRNEEYLFYQGLLGVWPFQWPDAEELATLRERLKGFMLKSLKEAKVNTSWINANEAYEQGVQAFIDAVLDEPNAAFVEDFRALQGKVAHFGAFNALAQALIKFTAPGVPDTYQGNEIWDFSLVDPDNRRPVDYALRRRLLDEVHARTQQHTELADYAAELLEHYADGRIKLFLTHQALHARADHKDVFECGEYLPLRAGGEHRAHVCAFARTFGEDTVVVIAPVLVAGLTRGAAIPPTGAVWGDTWLRLPGPRYRDRFTGRMLEAHGVQGRPGLLLQEALATFPVALLERL